MDEAQRLNRCLHHLSQEATRRNCNCVSWLPIFFQLVSVGSAMGQVNRPLDVPVSVGSMARATWPAASHTTRSRRGQGSGRQSLGVVPFKAIQRMPYEA